MKTLFTFLIALLPVLAQAQTNWPDCNTMVVNNVVLANDSLHVTLYNNCTNCNAGMDGPIYCEMRVIRTVAPYDTLGLSDCYCFFTPNNQSALTFKVKANVQQLPAFTDFLVEMMCNPTGCNIIPFSQNVGVEEDEVVNKIRVYPNPVADYLTVQGVVKGTELTLTDIAGKTVLTQLLQGSNNKVDISTLQKGIYMVHLSQCYIMYKSFKIVKQ